jgi:hypothetical protein
MNKQRNLFGVPPRFGCYFEGPEEDNKVARMKRLTGQLLDVYEAMKDGQRRTLRELEQLTGHPPASISAQLRHLRKKRFGEFVVEKEHIGNGLYQYWMVL